MKRYFNLLFKSVLTAITLTTVITSCTKGAPSANSLSVTPPSEIINFPATNTSETILSVETSADGWDFTAPDWIEATKEASTLKVRAMDNPYKSARVGRITFSANNAEPVNVPVYQNGNKSGISGPTGEIVFEDGKNEANVVVDKNAKNHNFKVKIILKEATTSTTKIKLAADPNFVNEYMDNKGIVCKAVDPTKITIDNAGIVEIPAGSKESTTINVNIALETLDIQTNYLVTITAESSNGIPFPVSTKRVNMLLKKTLSKAQRNICCLEVNNTNPLNLLEYRLEDGTYFFDVAVIFAANIVYDEQNNLVRLQNNPNIIALLDNAETYIKPLQDAGIEVQLGLMPHHTPAGLVNLSKKGAKLFATEVAETINAYNLDGVFLDEEWSKGTSNSDLFSNPPAPDGGLYLCYQLRKQMKEICGRECSISVFDVNWEEGNIDKVTGDDGKSYTAGELIDFHMPNYNGRPNNPWTGMTNQDCTGISIECNLGWGEMTESTATTIKKNDYGWVLWFGFHPQIGGGINNNAPRVDKYINIASQVFYGQKLATPTGYYKKIDSGIFDSQRYDRTW